MSEVACFFLKGSNFSHTIDFLLRKLQFLEAQAQVSWPRTDWAVRRTSGLNSRNWGFQFLAACAEIAYKSVSALLLSKTFSFLARQIRSEAVGKPEEQNFSSLCLTLHCSTLLLSCGRSRVKEKLFSLSPGLSHFSEKPNSRERLDRICVDSGETMARSFQEMIGRGLALRDRESITTSIGSSPCSDFF